MIPVTETDLVEHMVAFAEKFITQEKAERFADFARTSKGRQKWLAKLDHFQTTLSPLKRSQIISRNSAELLRSLPANSNSQVVVFSTLRGLGGARLSLSKAVEQTFKMSNGTVISIELGKLALYFGEELDECYLLS